MWESQYVPLLLKISDLTLAEYQNVKRGEQGNYKIIFRRIFSSFFAWLEDEDYIIKSPVRRIHRIKAASTIKETYTDETVGKL